MAAASPVPHLNPEPIPLGEWVLNKQGRRLLISLAKILPLDIISSLMTSFIVVYVTAKDRTEGRKIAQYLLDKKLAACVNIVDGIESHYRWEGQLERSNEVLLVIKTRKTYFAKVAKAVKAVHSYQVPEIIALPVVAGDKKYLTWLAGETRRET